MLGGAWESPDVAVAIAQIADDHNEFSIAELAFERYRELLRSGHRSLDSKMSEAAADEVSMSLQMGKEAPEGELPVASNFHLLRKEADAWNRVRTSYMLARLETGSHPDTDPAFWKGWRGSAMPRLNPQKVETQTAHNLRYLSYIIGAVFLVVVIGLVLLVVRTIQTVNRWVSGRRRTH